MNHSKFTRVAWRSGVAALLLAAVSLPLSFLSGCGSAGASCAPATIQMGGARQGNALQLAATVGPFAGGGLGTTTNSNGTDASFSYPSDITTDGSHLFVADSANNLIRQIVIGTAKVTTLAGGGAGTSTDGIGTAASFSSPFGVTTDGTNVYVSDTSNHLIRKIVIATGEVTTFAGDGTTGSSDGFGTAASFNMPWGITTDGANLYVTDIGNNLIRKIVIATGEVTTLAGGGAGTSTDGIGTAASFNWPWGITTDGTNLYVSDYSNNLIRKIVISSAEVTTFAGDGTGALTDGPGTSASFFQPAGIICDGSSLYVVDRGNRALRKIVLSTGDVTTLAGGGAASSTDGTGTTAQFSAPSNIATDGENLYLTDTADNLVRMVY